MIDQTDELIESFLEVLKLEDSDVYSSKIAQMAREILAAEGLTDMMRLDMLHQLINRWGDVVDL